MQLSPVFWQPSHVNVTGFHLRWLPTAQFRVRPAAASCRRISSYTRCSSSLRTRARDAVSSGYDGTPAYLLVAVALSRHVGNGSSSSHLSYCFSVTVSVVVARLWPYGLTSSLQPPASRGRMFGCRPTT